MTAADNGAGSGRVGLAVVDMQTFHRGHNNLLNEMRMACDRAIVGLGSIRKFGVYGHPFTFEQRREMIRTVHGDFFDFIGLDDIDAGRDMRDWYSYVTSKLERAGLPEPTDYFSGSRIDAKWYFHAFADDSHPAETHGTTAVHANPKTGKRLHIVNREALGLPSGREVRLLIETRDPEWKRYVPERLHRYIEMNYPPEIRQPVDFDASFASLPPATLHGLGFHAECNLGDAMRMDIVEQAMSMLGEYPVGTTISGKFDRLDLNLEAGGKWDAAALQEQGSAVLELKDDGKWRPVQSEDEKGAWAMAKAAGGAAKGGRP